MIKAKNITKVLCATGILMLGSCSSDDDSTIDVIQTFVPDTYVFERDGESTVSFSGQSARIGMAEEVIAELLDNTSTETIIDAMYDHQEGANDFEDAALNASDRSVRNKTADSEDFFVGNTVDATAIKSDFDGWIKEQVDDVFPFWAITATPGTAGVLQEAGGGSNRYVNSKGLELNQVFAKSLIGALMADQSVNNYLGTAILDANNNIENNNNEVLEEGKSYTTMEHAWDEAYGYLYGASVNAAEPNLTIGEDDSFLNKYIGRVEDDPSFTGIAEEIHNAFKIGRTAILAKDYATRNLQANIIRDLISQIIGVRAVFYLQQGKNSLEADTVDYASAFHDLSEGFGFIYSLQFTRRTDFNRTPYFSREEVLDLIDDLIGRDNGLWDLTPAVLDDISEAIAARFDFTVEEAGNSVN